MMKYTRLLSLLLCAAMLSGCNIPQAENKDQTIDKSVFESAFEKASEKASERTPPVPKTPSKTQDIVTTSVAPPDLDSEEGIREYLVGEWVIANLDVSEIACRMIIDADLGVDLSFSNVYTDELYEVYKGKIKLGRAYAQPGETPDLILIELENSPIPGIDAFFLHRTIYDGRRVMALFSSLYGTVFEILIAEGNYRYSFPPKEIDFEKVTGEASARAPRKNDEFHAVYWGRTDDAKSFWLDDVVWIPTQDYTPLYPGAMTDYENEIKESVLYSVSPNIAKNFNQLIYSYAYLVQTDERGSVISCTLAEYPSPPDDPALDIQQKIFEIIYATKELNDYLGLGMEIMFDWETEIVDGAQCYRVALGTDHEDQFVREIHYAVNIDTRQVYKYDVIFDSWDRVEMG